MKKNPVIMRVLLLCFSLPLFCAASPLAAQNLNVSARRLEVAYTVLDGADTRGHFSRAWSLPPLIITIVNDNAVYGAGAVSVCAWDTEAYETWVYEYSSAGQSGLELRKTMKFANEYPMLGAFAKDGEGNYYFFYGQEVDKNDRNKENMALVKYSASGEKLLDYKLKAYADNSWGGVMVPLFYAGACRLEVSGNMIAVYFGRRLFSGHQASYGFVLNKDTFERVDRGQVTNNNYTITGPMVMPNVGHSLNEFMLPLENGFVFADQGDGLPRSFTFAKFLPDTKTKTVNAFRFAGGHGQNETYAQMGGLAKTSSGFIFAGTYGKGAEKNARNLFVLTFDDNLTACGSPLYLTKYTIKEGHAAYPKIAPFGEGRFLLLWEQTGFNEWGFSTGYKTTWALVVNETGKVLSEARELPAVRLNMNDVLRYNHVTGKVYWAVNEGDNAIVIYSLGEAGDGADEE